MTHLHPDIADEQAYIEHAYDCLETSRKAAFRIRTLNEASMGGTFQARFERNAFDAQLVRRLEELELGASVCGKSHTFCFFENSAESATGANLFMFSGELTQKKQSIFLFPGDAAATVWQDADMGVRISGMPACDVDIVI